MFATQNVDTNEVGIIIIIIIITLKHIHVFIFNNVCFYVKFVHDYTFCNLADVPIGSKHTEIVKKKGTVLCSKWLLGCIT